MSHPMRPVIVPVESRVRELDAKLLLACAVAERGFRAILGARDELHLEATRLPRGIYVAKSLARSSERIFRILRGLGHDIVAGAEDGLLHLPARHHYDLRISPAALGQVSLLFAWGEENAELFRGAPGHRDAPIHVTGNPRGDLLRPDVRPCFSQEVAALRERFGEFILVNTNFSKLNHYLPKSNWSSRKTRSGLAPETDAFLSDLSAHRERLFAHFQTLGPALARAFPKNAVVVRPHPAEDPDVWQQIASDHENLQVTLEGNVIPWLLASRALVHNSCTTGIEAFLMGVPVVSYMPVTSEALDVELAAGLGHRASDLDELCSKLDSALRGELRVPEERERARQLAWNVTALEGPLASDRIADVLHDFEARTRGERRRRTAAMWLESRRRATSKWLRQGLLGDRRAAAYRRHRFPDVSEAELESRLGRFREQLDRFHGVRVKRSFGNVFEIVA